MNFKSYMIITLAMFTSMVAFGAIAWNITNNSAYGVFELCGLIAYAILIFIGPRVTED